MTLFKRACFALAIAAWPLCATGCFYQDFDLETVDHYSHYGSHHTVDAAVYRSDGSDY